MDISEFFRANTPPIYYHRIPDGGAELIDGCICLTNPPEYQELNKSPSIVLREKQALYHKFYKG